MRILLAGANGQLGHDCQRVLGAHYTVAAMDLPQLDIADAASVARAFETIQPELLVNAAAYTQVDQAEREVETAQRVNAQGPAILAEACRRAGAPMIHISTDYVFDGARPAPLPYRESDEPSPRTRYGRSKLEGETAVLNSGAQAAIFRTAWLYGQQGHNFLRTMLRLAREKPGQTLRVVDDQYGCPTWTGRLALQIAEWTDNFSPGLYHAAAEGHCTWFELAARFLARVGVPHRIEPCTSAQYPTSAPRPANSILENHALKATGRCVMLPWMEDLDAFADRVGSQWS